MKSIDKRRVHHLNLREDGGGPVVYWMSREQRVADNWGLLHAREIAGRTRPLVVVFCLVPSFLGATLRQYSFMLRGLQQVESDLAKLNIPFVLKLGNPESELVEFAKDIQAGVVVTDFDPLRIKQGWQRTAADCLDVPLIEVDGHNIVPARFVSDKREYAARTIRPKIQRNLLEFLEDFPDLEGVDVNGIGLTPVDWDVVSATIEVDESVGPVLLEPGEKAAQWALADFIETRLGRYAIERNDPNAEAVSGLSAYYHFGQLAPQRAALAVAASGQGDNQDSYLEELIVRRELSDNFCLHTPDYDTLGAAPEWAQKTLQEFGSDQRVYLYDYEEFEQASTHSSLWNAAQSQLVKSGFMHGYMRMYWAKKILEWSASAEDAVAIAIRLNDRFQLDGRDPSGYVGILWSVAGLHDRAWKKRAVFGSIRYMNERGCRRKFDVDKYVRKWL